MRTLTLPGILLLASLLGCGRKDAPPPAAAVPAENSTSHPIKAASGGVAGDSGGAQVSVPPGALPKDATIALTRKAPETHSSPGVKVVGSVWNFRVDGAEHFNFSKPVKIALPVDASLKGSAGTVGISVWSGERWQAVAGAHLDAASGKVAAEVDHFSAYAPTQEESSDPVERARDDLRRVYLNNEYWYGQLLVTIRGSGQKQGDLGGEAGYSIQREATVKFRVRAEPGELGMVTGLEKMKKFPGVPIPPEMTRQMEKIRDCRHWRQEMMKPEKEDRVDVHIAFKDKYSASSPKIQLGELIEEASSSLQTLGGGLDTQLERTGNFLEIDVAKGAYSFSVGGITGGVVEYHEERHSGEKDDEAKPKDTKAPAGLDFRVKDQKLPGLSGVLSGTKRIPRAELDSFLKGTQGNWHFGFGQVRGSVSWTLSPYPLDDVELVLAPKDYDDWLPKGGSAEGQKSDHPLRIQARLQKRGGGATKVKMMDLVVRLSDVSREPGICLNVPKEKGAETPDLQFAPGNGYTVEKEGTKVIKKNGEFDKLDLTLDCFDWGAWGNVTAQAVLKDGRVVWATLDSDPSEDEVRVPKRDPESKIADKWKKEMKVDDLKDLDDQEAQKGNRNNGDGLTMYEEYRGLIAKGKHTREYPAGPDGFRPLSPRRKDIVVANTIGNVPAVIAGFRLLEKAAGIHVVEVAPEDLPASRVVNVNRGTQTSAGEQRGLVLYDVTLLTGTTGLTVADLTKPSGSREQYDRVQVDLKQIRAFHGAGSKELYSADEEIAQTVAHEIAHALDLEHHGPGHEVTLQDLSKLWIYDRSRNKIGVPNPFQGAIGEPGNEASGDVRCIMCYNSMYTWSWRYHEFLFAADKGKLGTIFCTSQNGTGHNMDFDITDPQNPNRRKKIPGVFGKAIAGKCLEQMRIKDQKK